MSTDAPPPPQTDQEASFAETALKLGGKSDDEARRTGAIDKADDQVETLFAAQYQTVNRYGNAASPHRYSRAPNRRRQRTFAR